MLSFIQHYIVSEVCSIAVMRLFGDFGLSIRLILQDMLEVCVQAKIGERCYLRTKIR